MNKFKMFSGYLKLHQAAQGIADKIYDLFY